MSIHVTVKDPLYIQWVLNWCYIEGGVVYYSSITILLSLVFVTEELIMKGMYLQWACLRQSV